MKRIFLLIIIILVSALPVAAQEIKNFPAPNTVSPELQALIGAEPAPIWNMHPKNTKEWNDFVRMVAEPAVKDLPRLKKKTGVTVTSERISGVRVYNVIPANISPENKNRVLLHFHGGGYVLNPGEAVLSEAVLMAGYGDIRVVSVDYRMLPDHPYPAAMDDAVSVYKELIKKYDPKQIGVFGTSTGGGMTLALTLRAKKEGLPLPGALAAGTPWTDLTKTGDSYFVNDGVDNMLVSYEGWLGDAAKAYANGHDMKDPMLSPVYGDVSSFPPTILTTGTRDLFLSNTVRMHLKLREAGVTADLIVFEGMSHTHYLMSDDMPETKLHFNELSKFFNRYLK